MAADANLTLAVIVLDYRVLRAIDGKLESAAYLINRAWRDAPTDGGYLDLIEAVRLLREAVTEITSEAKAHPNV